jgi:hypothetical protein
MQAIREITHYCKLVYKTLGNRRRHERLPIEGPVNATWKNRYGQLVTHACNCLDVCQKGVAITSAEPASVSADVYVYASRYGLKSFASVRYCRPDAAGYRIGLHFRAEPAMWDGF